MERDIARLLNSHLTRQEMQHWDKAFGLLLDAGARIRRPAGSTRDGMVHQGTKASNRGAIMTAICIANTRNPTAEILWSHDHSRVTFGAKTACSCVVARATLP